MPSGDGSASLQPSNTALDGVASAVKIRIEGSRAALTHVAAGPGWNDRSNVTSTEIMEDGPVAVGLVARQMLGSCAWTASWAG
jgi:hypothetical protein